MANAGTSVAMVSDRATRGTISYYNSFFVSFSTFHDHLSVGRRAALFG